MQSDFKPRHLKKANEKLSMYLSKVEVYADTNQESKKKVFKGLILWEKFLALFKRKPAN